MPTEVSSGGDLQISLARSRARAAYDHARARREKAKADLLEGKTIFVTDALEQIQGLCSSIRRQLDLAPAYLSSDLTPDVREAAAEAMRSAITRALSELEKPTKIVQPVEREAI